ncbi:hypothetical protein HH310_05205 [Actinoplanes sp. TBRC 11911]|uniref:hypothetical protein n=1 Tax=Actinoplanes sp. TBRC 11911 TaxID=2729386 RepID=UPI00145E3EFE|nr:hypothetical protein [Actinoplanes sp. TBRC 11911]NMO50590.1 hypothetical protein [Actinoplanes sp. TBRC 11911]
MTGEKTDSPATLAWAVRLLYLETLGLVALTVVLIVDAIRNRSSVGAGLAVMALIAAAVVFFTARGLGRQQRGARGPGIVIQLFVIASGGFLIQVHPVWLGVLMIVLGAAVGALLVVPPTTKALGLS